MSVSAFPVLCTSKSAQATLPSASFQSCYVQSKTWDSLDQHKKIQMYICLGGWYF